ncbi:MAG: cupin domain-containing protein [Candidatus Cloacimonetes bacterium]|nr:cupin domain-containing protein [Candidatus Cloacimonadota bacterium]MCF7813001.1 cupin domain-containing protein [Candidatus Cloacimonadota bacterium]MCF7867267.1 cupin domain-containing protein [Candidatus Cloacimonadota bacterium]MCF7882711.1 cupin domain-containing protein [Candidatus Cloacimonadota bacterium]
MKIRNFQNLEQSKNPHGIQSFKLYDKDHAIIMHLLLKAGESLKPHITPVDVAFYVLEGKPAIMVGDEKVQVKKDDIIESPKDIIHCIYNESDTDVRVLVMKMPKPATKTVMV